MIRHKDLPTVTFVVDGLDECESKSLEDLLKKVRSLYPVPQDSESSSSDSSSTGKEEVPEKLECKLRILCNSRYAQPKCLRSYLQHNEHVALDEMHIKEIREDVQLFVKSKIKATAEFDKWNKDLRSEVTQEITKRAEGVYLWASFVIEELKNCEGS